MMPACNNPRSLRSTMLRTADLDYDLPPDRIATHPVEPRDAARLMVVNRQNPDQPQHHHIRDLPTLLAPGDLLIVNRSRVIPARFLGLRLDTGGRVEGLYVDSTPDGHWRIMLKARRFREGAPIELLDRHGQRSGVTLTLLRRDADDAMLWHVASSDAASLPPPAPPTPALEVLDRIGLTPLPPYIRARRKIEHAEIDDAHDRERYQTVFAAEAGSVAAPTAGLHFTPELLNRLSAVGIGRADVTLHVGLGTFKPVETEFVEQHPMHAEWCSMPDSTASAIREARDHGGRIIAVGTTAARTLESLAVNGPPLPGTPPLRGGSWGTLPLRGGPPGSSPLRGEPASDPLNDDVAEGGDGSSSQNGDGRDVRQSRHGMAGYPTDDRLGEAGYPEATHTRLLITPGHRWQWTDGLLTNFHLPRSTLMAMVAAMLPGGAAQLTRLYTHAVDRGYRFYSYGDAMLILP